MSNDVLASPAETEADPLNTKKPIPMPKTYRAARSVLMQLQSCDGYATDRLHFDPSTSRSLWKLEKALLEASEPLAVRPHEIAADHHLLMKKIFEIMGVPEQ